MSEFFMFLQGVRVSNSTRVDKLNLASYPSSCELLTLEKWIILHRSNPNRYKDINFLHIMKLPLDVWELVHT